MTRDLKSQLVSGELLDGFRELLLEERLPSRRTKGYGGGLRLYLYEIRLQRFLLDFIDQAFCQRISWCELLDALVTSLIDIYLLLIYDY